MKIRVIHENGFGFTTPKNAQRYLSQKRAVWADDSKTAIRFIPDDPGHRACLEQSAQYSDGGRAGFDQSQDVFGGDVEAISRLLSPAEGDWGWIYAVYAADRRNGVPVTLSGTVAQYGRL